MISPELNCPVTLLASRPLSSMSPISYGPALAIPRGERPEDEELILLSFREEFARGSTPDPSPNVYPSLECESVRIARSISERPGASRR